MSYTPLKEEVKQQKTYKQILENNSMTTKNNNIETFAKTLLQEFGGTEQHKINQNASPYSIDFPEVAIEKIEKDFDEKIKASIKSKLKKSIEEVREEIELEYYTEYADNLKHFLDDIVLDKAKALVTGLLEGDESCVRTFLEFGYSRDKILASVIDYTAKIEIEKLKETNKWLHESLDFERGGIR